MKQKFTPKINLLVILVSIILLLGFRPGLLAQAPQGSTCENPLPVDPVNAPLINLSINSQDYGDDYSSTMVTPSTNYLNGNDIVFQFTLTQKSFIYSSIQGEWTGLIFVAVCPGTPAAPRLAFAGGSNGATVPTFALDPGSYFMIASSNPLPDFTQMLINFSAEVVPTLPTLTSNPESLYVGMASPGLHSATNTIALINGGIENIIINEGAITFNGNNAADFAFSLASGDSYPLTIPFGESKILTVVFNPSSTGLSEVNMNISYNNTSNPVKSIPVSGMGYSPLNTFFETFDAVSPVPTGWLPDGWTRILQSSSTTANVNVLASTTAFSPPNLMRFASGIDLQATLILVSPAVTNLANKRIVLPARMGSSSHTGQFQVGYLTSRTDASTFVPVNTFDITGAFQLYNTDFQASGLTLPEVAYIGIRYLPLANSRTLQVDNVKYEDVPTQPIFNVNKTEYAFDTVYIYENASELLQIYNTGVGNLTINEAGINITGEGAEAFSLIYPEGHTWPISLAFGQAINLTVKFVPTEGIDYEAILNIEDNTTAKVVNSISLSGSGKDATVYPTVNYDFIGDFPPTNWRKFFGTIAEANPVPTTANTWYHGYFGNDLSLPEFNSAGIRIGGLSVNHWLFTPPIDLGTGQIDYKLTFNLSFTQDIGTGPATMLANQKFGVVISPDGGLTWNDTNVLQWWNSTTPISNTGETVIIDLAAYTGRIMIGFYAESRAFGVSGRLFFNNVSIAPSFPIANLPVEIDFEGDAFPPADWTVVTNAAATPNWESSTAQNHTTDGTKSAFHAAGEAGVTPTTGLFLQHLYCRQIYHWC
jgi:hypothetical protein